MGGAPMGGGPKPIKGGAQKGGAPKGGAQKGGAPKGWGAQKFRAFSSLSRHRFAVSVSLWGSSRGFLVVFVGSCKGDHVQLSRGSVPR